ncbi:MAG: DUF202 domain-containing protein [Thermovirgaceae bacterium]
MGFPSSMRYSFVEMEGIPFMDTRKKQGNGEPPSPEKELTLRNRLAIGRSCMANERTFLAYVRTALALAFTGAGIIGYFHSRPAFWGGLLLVGAACLTGLTGFRHFLSMKSKIRSAEEGEPPYSDD